MRGNGAVQGKTRLDNLMDRFFIWEWKRARVAHANGADIHIGLFLEWIILARAKHLAFGFQLGVHFKSYSGDIFHKSFWTRMFSISCATFPGGCSPLIMFICLNLFVNGI